MDLVIDKREKPSRRLDVRSYMVANTDDVCVTEDTLLYGDYLFTSKSGNESVVFEFKTIDDFMNSSKDGSLFEEVINQTVHYNYSYLVIEGSIEEYIKRMWSIRRIRNAWSNDYRKFLRVTFNGFKGAFNRCLTICPVITGSTLNNVLKDMVDVSDKIINNDNHFVFGSKRRIKHDNKLIALLSNVCGKKTAKLIVDSLELKGLKDLLTVTTEDLTSIKGIGVKKARVVTDFIYGE